MHVETQDGAMHRGIGAMFDEKDGKLVNPGVSEKCWTAVEKMMFEMRKNKRCQSIIYKAEGIHANEEAMRWDARHSMNTGAGQSKQFSHHIRTSSPLVDCHCMKMQQHGYKKALLHCTFDTDMVVYKELDGTQANIVPDWCKNLKV